jgi:hypothetical protein
LNFSVVEIEERGGGDVFGGGGSLQAIYLHGLKYRLQHWLNNNTRSCQWLFLAIWI